MGDPNGLDEDALKVPFDAAPTVARITFATVADALAVSARYSPRTYAHQSIRRTALLHVHLRTHDTTELTLTHESTPLCLVCV